MESIYFIEFLAKQRQQELLGTFGISTQINTFETSKQKRINLFGNVRTSIKKLRSKLKNLFSTKSGAQNGMA